MSITHKNKLNNNRLNISHIPKDQERFKIITPNQLSSNLAFNTHEYLNKQARILNNKNQNSISPKKDSLVKIQEEKYESKENDIVDSNNIGKCIYDSNLIQEKSPLYFPYENLYLKIPTAKTNLSNPQKARMIRQINLKIQLLQSKSKQPGVSLQELNPLRQQIYNKFDQYYITHRQIKSRFIDTDRNQAQNQKISPFPSKLRKFSKELSPDVLKMNSKNNSPRSSLSKKSSKISPQAKLFSAKMIDSSQEDQKINIKTYKTVTNISVVSLTHRSNNQQQYQRPVFQTQISQNDLMQLDRQPKRKMSEESEQHHQSYIELKENVRIMEQRIGFLIHRLEENKKEINLLREGKDTLQKRCFQKEKENFSIAQEKKQIHNSFLSLQAQNKRLKEKYDEKVKENQSLEKEILQFQKQVCQLTNELYYLSEKLKLKENEFNTVEDLLSQKKGQNQQINHNLRALQRQFNRKKKDFLKQLQDKQQQNQQLKTQLKQQKSRMQVQGINFKFQQAAKLKKYIEQNEELHQRQILKLDSSYSSVINTYEEQNRRIKNQKIQLENALIQWLGNYNKLQKEQKELQEAKFKSEVIKLQAIQMQIGDVPGSRISKEFIALLQNYSQLEKEKNEQIVRNNQLQTKWRVFKEEYDELIEKKSDQSQILTKKINELKSVNRLLANQKEEALHQIKQLQQQLSNTQTKATDKSRILLMKIQSNKINFNYPQNYLASSDNGITFQKIMDKLIKAPFRQKLQIAIKLIDLAESLGNKKKLPSLNPACLTVQFNKNSTDFSIQFGKNTKEQDDQNLHYCSPQVLLGFNQTHQSHCWTVGIVLDKLIHGKEYFNQYSQIISRKQNYIIRDEKYKSLDFLNDMLKKNQRQRINLNQAKQRIVSFLQISLLQ